MTPDETGRAGDERLDAPSFWRWIIGVNFLGRPIGWTHQQYQAWLLAEHRAGWLG